MVSEAKRLKHNAPTSSRFKGVVLQQNGHWGAQIYANHQRIWLGTFKSEKAAAMAYDSAAIKLRSGDAHRNFPWTHLSKQEPTFQNLFSTEAVLTMIKDGSYESKFAEFLNTHSQNFTNDNTLLKTDGGGVSKQQLFEKVLTPSDVGKLNRLVIPKKHAVKYFPRVPETDRNDMEDNKGGATLLEDVQLVFFDAEMRSWKFRYCYWKSSQSFVFTRGWNRFVKDKELMANDLVSFYRCEYRQGYEVKSFCLIEVAYNREIGDENQEKDLGFELGLGGGREEKMEEEEEEEEEEKEKIVQTCTPLPLPFPSLEKQSLRLFGVEIIVAHKA